MPPKALYLLVMAAIIAASPTLQAPPVAKVHFTGCAAPICKPAMPPHAFHGLYDKSSFETHIFRGQKDIDALAVWLQPKDEQGQRELPRGRVRSIWQREGQENVRHVFTAIPDIVQTRVKHEVQRKIDNGQWKTFEKFQAWGDHETGELTPFFRYGGKRALSFRERN